MALSATIYKADLQVSDLDRGYYGGHNLTLACHPSETTERMMLRLVAFARHASEALKFTRGISSDDEPDLWEHHDYGDVKLWIELGLPEERRLRQACGKSDEVWLYAYGGRALPVWWQQNAGALRKLDKLSVVSVDEATLAALDAMAARTMQLSCTIQDGTMWLADGEHNLEIVFETLQDHGRQA
ncbi:YaeQ family protein [Chitinimonas koreensis]|uniref:YaeQ family protein n=1 Tax=Chitinimonas koreensis TaxID=356302 RepID=UPI0004140C93|nr:YaeQ family protein [Chitinimonas koreensis]QNM96858.1 YaeQ family protein [Chitinimonas koreensis]